MVQSVSTFGAFNSPGFYGIFGWGAVGALGRLKPPESHLNGAESFLAGLLMDDAVLVNAALGIRSALAREAYIEIVHLVFGPGSVNQSKLLKDGPPSEVGRFWGYVLDGRDIAEKGPLGASIAAAPHRVENLRIRVGAVWVEFLAGQLTLKRHQQLMGTVLSLTLVSSVCRYVAPSFFLASSSQTHLVLVGTPDEIDEHRRAYGASLLLLLLMLEDAKSCSTPFVSTLAQVLSPPEQRALGLPHFYTQHDATGVNDFVDPEGFPLAATYAAAVPALGVYGVGVGGAICRRILTAMGRQPRDIWVQALEGLAVAVIVLTFGPRFTGGVVTAVTDNYNVFLAIRRGWSSDPITNWLLGLMARCTGRYAFALTAVYINTKRNPLADGLTRLYHESTPQELQVFAESFLGPGAKRVELGELNELLAEAAEAAAAGGYQRFFPDFRLPGEGANSLAVGLGRAAREAVSKSCLPVEPPTLRQLKGLMVEVFAGVGAYALAAERQGLTCAALVGGDSLARGVGAGRLRVMPRLLGSPFAPEVMELPTDGVLLVCAGPPPPAREGEPHPYVGLMQLVAHLSPKVVVVEALPDLCEGKTEPALQRLIEGLSEQSYQYQPPWGGLSGDEDHPLEVVDAADLGAPLVRRRSILHFEKEELAGMLGPLAGLSGHRAAGRTLDDVLDPLDQITEEWVHGRFEPGPPTRCSAVIEGPVVHGYLRVGPGCSGLQRGSHVQLKHHSGVWEIEVKPHRAQLKVRELASGRRITVAVGELVSEYSEAHPVLTTAGKGYPASASPAGIASYGGSLVWDTRSPPGGVALSSKVRRLTSGEIWRAQGLTASDARTLQGAVAGETFERARCRVAGLTTPLELAGAAVDRATARLRMEYIPSSGAEAPTRAAGGPRRSAEGERLDVALGDGADGRLRLGAAMLVGRSVGTGTHTTYRSSWKHWVSWCLLRERNIYLTGDDERGDEQELLLFVSHKFMVVRLAHGTIHVILYAVRFYHLTEGHADPLQNKPRLVLAMKGASRIQGGGLQKIPASMDLLMHSMATLDLDNWDDLMLATALILGFLFLLRSREFLRKDSEPDPRQCLRVGNIALARDGKLVGGRDVGLADEVIVLMGASKTDPNGKGSVANAYAVPGHRYCLVALLQRAYRLRPGHFSRGDNYLLTMSDGRVLHRDRVQAQLRVGGDALGAPPAALSVISLRSGGASAMWDEGYKAEEIKRRGRWASDCWHVYVWEGRDRWKDLASRLLTSSYTLMASLASYRRRE